MYQAHRRPLAGRLLDAVVGTAILALLARVAAIGAAELMARYVYGGGAPVGVRFVEGRYGLVPVRGVKVHDVRKWTTDVNGVAHAA